MTRRIVSVQAIQATRRIPAQIIALCDDGTVLRMIVEDERWIVLPDAPQPEHATVDSAGAMLEYDASKGSPVRWWGK